MNNDYLEKKFAFFQHLECEYFPCHKVGKVEDFNCLFCYCPLFALGENCGGNYAYNEDGYKDCSGCAFPHVRTNYPKILARYSDIMELAKQK